MGKPDKVHFYASAGGLVIRGDEMLLVRKRAVPELRMPKGHIEPGEDREQAALREVREETGYADLRILADLGTQTASFNRYGHPTVRDESAFLMTLDGDGQHPRTAGDEERFEPVWAPLADAPTLLTYPTEQEFARRALAWLRRSGQWPVASGQ